MVLISSAVIAQEEVKKPSVKISGYVRYEAFYDTYKSVDTRDGDVYLYPLAESLDASGNDINENGRLEMLSLQSRLKFAVTGPDAFGAKTSAVIETDLLGTSQNYTRMFRLRHAFMKLNWEKSELLMGQYWHPMWNPKCFPATLSFGAGVPFHVLNRSPQLRLTRKLTESITIMGAASMQGYHKSVGPATAQRDAGLPDMQIQLAYNSGPVYASLTAGYKWLKPILFTIDTISDGTDNKYVFNEISGSFNVQASLAIKAKPVTFKVQAILGENMTNYVMIGGYGMETGTMDQYGHFEYANLKTMSTWADLSSNNKKINWGLFGGYSANLGSDVNYTSLSYGRGENIASIFRVAPRVTYTSGKTMFGFEYMLGGAVYATSIDANGKASATADPTMNNRFLFSAKYSF